MSETPDDGDEFTELVDANFGRVDLVGKGANGIPFLVAKADPAGGVLPADLVRSLLDTDRPEAVTKEDHVTISGSPAAVMKTIYEAARRQSSTLKSEGGPAVDEVTKADPVAEVDVEVADVVGTAPGGGTAETVPGSPDWENLDADTALNAIALLARVKNALGWLADREATEAVNGDGSDGLAAMDLEDTACQLDSIIRRLAGFAMSERLEAELDDEMGEVEKAVAGLGDVASALSVLETFGPVVKAGRVLSTANEAAIRSASDSLQKVLASLPAPIADDQPVAKEKETTVEDVTKADEPVEPVEKADEVAPAAADAQAAAGEAVEKAKGDPQVAVYDASGNLVGTIDPKDLSPIASATPPAGGDADSADAAPATEDDLTPAPADAAGVAADAPADAAAAAPAAPAAEPDPAAVAKSTDDVLKEMLDAHLEAALKDHPVVKALEEKVAHLEAPAPSRVLVNGAQLPADLRGMGDSPLQVDVAKADDLRAKLETASTVSEREDVLKQMNELASAGLEAIRVQGIADRTARRR